MADILAGRTGNACVIGWGGHRATDMIDGIVELQMKSTQRDWVAKHGRRLNRSRVFADRKKALKRGYCKHRPGWS